tara:strand:- start:871 stop:1221 length:351 start_codon:yes stop_codon:yes gene_type:complete
MSKAYLFHNPRCSKSRQALEILKKTKEKFEVILYLDEGLDEILLKNIIDMLGITPRELLRKGEDAYRENNLKDLSINDKSLIKLMIEYPKLIERPIFVKDDRAIIGRPPENVLKIV